MKLNINGVVVEVSNAELSKAIEDKKESMDIKSDDLVVRTKEAQEKYESNVKVESQKVGEEIGRKEVFKALEIDIEGTGAYKTAEKSSEALKSWSKSAVEAGVKDAGIDPDKKLEAANKDLEQLRETLGSVRGELETSKGNHTVYVKKQDIRSDIASNLPDNISLTKQDAVDLILLRKSFDKDEHGNTFEIGTDGQPMKDADRNVLPVTSSITSFFDTNPNYLTGASGGAGGGDSGKGDKLKTFSTFNEEMAEAGHSLNGEEYREEMGKQQEAGILEK